MIDRFFRSFNIFTEQEIEAIVNLFVSKRVNKNEYFVREGEYCSEIAFIKSGIFRSFYASHQGEEITYCFRFPNDLLAAYSSFITGNGSLENLQALYPCDLLVIKKYQLDKLQEDLPKMTNFLKIIAEQQYIELEKRVFQLQRDSAIQRYVLLLENQPEYILRIPLQYLASYLGITQRHLSRIRKEITIRQLS